MERGEAEEDIRADEEREAEERAEAEERERRERRRHRVIGRGLLFGDVLAQHDERAARHAELVAAVARARIAGAGLGDRVEIVEGDAAVTLSGVAAHGPFDLVFLDADKGRYDLYGRWAAANLRPGGLLIADNAYFFGRLLEPDDADAGAMRRFHEEAAARFETVCVPTPDGLLLGLLRAG